MINLVQKCDAFQTEIQFLTLSVAKLEGELQKKDKEIDRLKKETKVVSEKQENEKELKTQVSPLFLCLLPPSPTFHGQANSPNVRAPFRCRRHPSSKPKGIQQSPLIPCF